MQHNDLLVNSANILAAELEVDLWFDGRVAALHLHEALDAVHETLPHGNLGMQHIMLLTSTQKLTIQYNENLYAAPINPHKFSSAGKEPLTLL